MDWITLLRAQQADFIQRLKLGFLLHSEKEGLLDELWGCEVNFKFPIVKLLDYSEQWNQLETSSNPFATVVMAHLKAKETRQNSEVRKRWKLYLTKQLYEKGYQREDIINLRSIYRLGAEIT